jgi:DNA-binding Lrp family transcriptional regulator
MPKELPIVEEALKDIVEAKTPLSVIAKKLGVSEESARAKIRRLGLVVDDRPKTSQEEDALISAGFEYVRFDDKEQVPIYRKKK